jgi:hypothetical protein
MSDAQTVKHCEPAYGTLLPDGSGPAARPQDGDYGKRVNKLLFWDNDQKIFSRVMVRYSCRLIEPKPQQHKFNIPVQRSPQRRLTPATCARKAPAKAREMNSEWATVSSDMQVSLSREALHRARHLISAQAELLAEQMDLGAVPRLDGPDALRLLSIILSQEPDASRLQ